jgi:hypothetical protein
LASGGLLGWWRPGVGNDPKRPDANRRTERQDFAFNLSAKRRLCNTVGRRIGRAKARTTYRCAVTAARCRAATICNLARASRALVLRTLFGASKSCALVNLFMICPRCSASSQPTTPEFCLSSRLSDDMLGRSAQRPVAFAFDAYGVAVGMARAGPHCRRRL